MLAEGIDLEISVSLNHIDHDRSPCYYIALLCLIVKVHKAANDIGTESA